MNHRHPMISIYIHTHRWLHIYTYILKRVYTRYIANWLWTGHLGREMNHHHFPISTNICAYILAHVYIPTYAYIYTLCCSRYVLKHVYIYHNASRARAGRQGQEMNHHYPLISINMYTYILTYIHIYLHMYICSILQICTYLRMYTYVILQIVHRQVASSRRWIIIVFRCPSIYALTHLQMYRYIPSHAYIHTHTCIYTLYCESARSYTCIHISYCTSSTNRSPGAGDESSSSSEDERMTAFSRPSSKLAVRKSPEGTYIRAYKSWRYIYTHVCTYVRSAHACMHA